MEIHTKPFMEKDCKQLRIDRCNGVCVSKNLKTGKKQVCPHYETVEICDKDEPCKQPKSPQQ